MELCGQPFGDHVSEVVWRDNVEPRDSDHQNNQIEAPLARSPIAIEHRASVSVMVMQDREL
jgi:hypothetical protein